MPCCWEADVKAENHRIAGGTSKIEPDVLGQEKQEKGHEGDNKMEKNKKFCSKVSAKKSQGVAIMGSFCKLRSCSHIVEEFVSQKIMQKGDLKAFGSNLHLKMRNN